MGLKVCVLASGSSGNCLYIGNETTHVLVDAGVSCRCILERLTDIGVEPSQINGLCVTHEHGDHQKSLGALQRKLGMPLYGNAGTVEAIGRSAKHNGLEWQVFTTGHPFRIGNISVMPFRVPHDSYDPVGFTFRDADSCVGVCTDLGMATDLVRDSLRGCDVLVLETNHDDELLLASQRPWSLKQRVLGRKGHLSNEKAAVLLCDIWHTGLRSVFLAHVSRDCNRPELALEVLARAVAGKSGHGIQFYATYPDRRSDVVVAGEILAPPLLV